MSSKELTEAELDEQIEKARAELQREEAEAASFREQTNARAEARRAFTHQLRLKVEPIRRQVEDDKGRERNELRAISQDKPELLRVCSNMTMEEATAFVRRCNLTHRKQIDALDHDIRVTQRSTEELEMKCQVVESAADEKSNEEERDKEGQKKEEEVLEQMLVEAKAAQSSIDRLRKTNCQPQKEVLTCPAQFEGMEKDGEKNKQKLEDLRTRLCTAQRMTEDAEVELERTEKFYAGTIKERESQKAGMMKELKDLQASNEDLVKKIQMKKKQKEEQRAEADRNNMMADKDEEVRSVYNQAFLRIKEATGISSIQDLRNHFLSLKDSREHLMTQLQEGKTELQQLREDEDLLTLQLKDVRGKVLSVRCRNKQELERLRQQIQEGQVRIDGSKKQVSDLKRTMVPIRVMLEHLAERLKPVQLPGPSAAVSPPDSDQYLQELLAQCELKVELIKQLQADQADAGPSSQSTQQQRALGLLEDSADVSEEEEDYDVLYRDEVKRESQRLINNSRSKQKRRQRKKSRR